MELKSISLIIAIAGLFILSFYLIFSKPMMISSYDDLKYLKNNQKIVTSGKVIEERPSQNTKTLTLDTGIKIVCNNPCPKFKDKNISAIALVQEFNNKKSLNVLKIIVHN